MNADVGLDDLDTLVTGFGIEAILETLADVCDNRGDENEDENSRKWRVRANAMRKLKNEYVAFCSARNA